ncbi:hypothetical protein G6F56_012708 [Rhizopus delemar]|nr:hypothetical protein G6F56_012708 [Rhizopus delemar]
MTETGHALTETLSGFYETVIDQVMLDVSEDILKYIPSSISHENIQARHSVIKSMDRQLNFMRASLLASVNPLVSLDIHRTVELEQSDLEDTEKLTKKLITALPSLNEKISHQLGLIINAKQSSVILMRQAASLVHRTTMGKSTAIKVEWKLRQPFQINVVRENQYNQEMDTTIESQWLLEKLSKIEINLLDEFNDRVQEVAELVTERFIIDV